MLTPTLHVFPAVASNNQKDFSVGQSFSRCNLPMVFDLMPPLNSTALYSKARSLSVSNTSASGLMLLLMNLVLRGEV